MSLLKRPYTADEVVQIVAAARATGLNYLTCPRDRCSLRVEIGTYQLVDRGQTGRGVKHGDFKDVHSLGVTCPECGGDAGNVPLTR